MTQIPKSTEENNLIDNANDQKSAVTDQHVGRSSNSGGKLAGCIAQIFHMYCINAYFCLKQLMR